MKLTLEIDYPDNKHIIIVEREGWGFTLEATLEMVEGLLRAAGFFIDGHLDVVSDEDCNEICRD